MAARGCRIIRPTRRFEQVRRYCTSRCMRNSTGQAKQTMCGCRELDSEANRFHVSLACPHWRRGYCTSQSWSTANRPDTDESAALVGRVVRDVHTASPDLPFTKSLRDPLYVSMASWCNRPRRVTPLSLPPPEQSSTKVVDSAHYKAGRRSPLQLPRISRLCTALYCTCT
ncbi:hypothetical protein BCV70DRAFT_126612 [Testicularia cyperi]|uniref:Uncharacterized protein n=1 Tax=Testicularia cyperi TaxID=1882483 RepID=A0A317XLN0_9BASI|nr:hypothetical protein BCV70DRAFT_126612 [Testicularia cyperi]